MFCQTIRSEDWKHAHSHTRAGARTHTHTHHKTHTHARTHTHTHTHNTTHTHPHPPAHTYTHVLLLFVRNLGNEVCFSAYNDSTLVSRYHIHSSIDTARDVCSDYSRANHEAVAVSGMQAVTFVVSLYIRSG